MQQCLGARSICPGWVHCWHPARWGQPPWWGWGGTYFALGNCCWFLIVFQNIPTQEDGNWKTKNQNSLISSSTTKCQYHPQQFTSSPRTSLSSPIKWKAWRRWCHLEKLSISWKRQKDHCTPSQCHTRALPNSPTEGHLLNHKYDFVWLIAYH